MSSNANETRTARTGLTTEETEARLNQFGPNEPAATKHYSFLFDLLHAFANPLVLILVIAAVASAFLGDKVDGGIIGTIVLLSIVIDLSQTYRSQRAVEQLRDRVAEVPSTRSSSTNLHRKQTTSRSAMRSRSISSVGGSRSWSSANPNGFSSRKALPKGFFRCSQVTNWEAMWNRSMKALPSAFVRKVTS